MITLRVYNVPQRVTVLMTCTNTSMLPYLPSSKIILCTCILDGMHLMPVSVDQESFEKGSIVSHTHANVLIPRNHTCQINSS